MKDKNLSDAERAHNQLKKKIEEYQRAEGCKFGPMVDVSLLHPFPSDETYLLRLMEINNELLVELLNKINE